MITRTDAERIARAVNVLRPDWRVASLVTLIVRDLDGWPLLDLAVALTYVALDRTVDGAWASRTPARVKEDGPWRQVGLSDPDLDAYWARQRREREQRRVDREAMWAAVADCELCDPRGYLPGGRVCHHDLTAEARARAGAEAAAAEMRALDLRRREVAAAPPRLELEHFTVEAATERGAVRHAAIVGPGVLCGDRSEVEAVAWEHGTANVDCPPCLQVLAGQKASS